jgi:hypothetical protein
LTSNPYTPGGGGGGGGGGGHNTLYSASKGSGASSEIRACWEQFVKNEQRIDGMIWTPVIAERCVEKFERLAEGTGYITSRALLELIKTLDWSRIQALEARFRWDPTRPLRRCRLRVLVAATLCVGVECVCLRVEGAQPSEIRKLGSSTTSGRCCGYAQRPLRCWPGCNRAGFTPLGAFHLAGSSCRSRMRNQVGAHSFVQIMNMLSNKQIREVPARTMLPMEWLNGCAPMHSFRSGVCREP